MPSKKTPSNRGADTARKIWLAGIGAYGRAFSEAQESITRVGEETSKVFDDLVSRGETIEETMEERGREVAAKVAPGNLIVDERIKVLRSKIGLPADGGINMQDEVDDLKEQLVRIESKLDLLLSEKTAPAPKPSSRKSAPRKKATTKRSN